MLDPCIPPVEEGEVDGVADAVHRIAMDKDATVSR
jgi:hypothetical protein